MFYRENERDYQLELFKAVRQTTASDGAQVYHKHDSVLETPGNLQHILNTIFKFKLEKELDGLITHIKESIGWGIRPNMEFMLQQLLSCGIEPVVTYSAKDQKPKVDLIREDPEQTSPKRVAMYEYN